MELGRYADCRLHLQEYHDGAYYFKGNVLEEMTTIFVIFTPNNLLSNITNPVNIRNLYDRDHSLLWVTIKNPGGELFDDEVEYYDFTPRLQLVG